MEQPQGFGSNSGGGASRSFLRKVPEIAAILGWIVPGLGHYYSGLRTKAVIIFVSLLTAFLIGIVLSDYHAVSLVEHKYAFFAQIGAGGPALLTLLMAGGSASEEAGRAIDPLNSIGLLYTMVAGLLNFIVVCDAYERTVRGHSDVG